MSIAYDPYKFEVVESADNFLKGGDGGGNICGGMGLVLGYLPTSPYYRNFDISRYKENLVSDYITYRKIKRL